MSRSRSNTSTASVSRSRNSSKRMRLDSTAALTLSVPTTVGTVYMFGMGDIGQLGIDAEKRKYPALVPELPDGGAKVVQVQCGSTHTVVLLASGEVYTYGNNDDGALGRNASSEEDMKVPGRVEIPEKVVQISAGDSHTAALTDTGVVYAWGSFRNANGLMGLVAGDKGLVKQPLAFQLYDAVDDVAVTPVAQIASGSNHLVMRTAGGQIYTCGSNDQSQLGRVKPRTSSRRTMNPQSDTEFCLTPLLVRSLGSKKVAQVWTGDYSTYCKVRSGPVWAFGLNNFGQLGVKPVENDDTPVIAVPVKSPGLQDKDWIQIAASEHHMLALDSDGIVHAAGRNEDGRLGLGDSIKDRQVWQATVVPKLRDIPCSSIACGLSTSYAVSKENQKLYAWGFGENFQLAKGDDEDAEEPVPCKFSAKEDTLVNVVHITAGAQHVGLVKAADNKAASEANNNAVSNDVPAIPEVETGTLKRKKAGAAAGGTALKRSASGRAKNTTKKSA